KQFLGVAPTALRKPPRPGADEGARVGLYQGMARQKSLELRMLMDVTRITNPVRLAQDFALDLGVPVQETIQRAPRRVGFHCTRLFRLCARSIPGNAPLGKAWP